MLDFPKLAQSAARRHATLRAAARVSYRMGDFHADNVDLAKARECDAIGNRYARMSEMWADVRRAAEAMIRGAEWD